MNKSAMAEVKHFLKAETMEQLELKLLKFQLKLQQESNKNYLKVWAKLASSGISTNIIALRLEKKLIRSPWLVLEGYFLLIFTLKSPNAADRNYNWSNWWLNWHVIDSSQD